jgi:hypothetical protein
MKLRPLISVPRQNASARWRSSHAILAICVCRYKYPRISLGGPARATWDHEHGELAEGELARMRDELAASGSDVGALDDAEVIHAWEHAHADELGRAPLWGNVRVAAHSFGDFLELLEPDPDYA